MGELGTVNASRIATPEPETIVACATPVGSGGVGIVRLSGPRVPTLIESLCKKKLTPRVAEYCTFTHPKTGEALDEGLAIYFPAPHSFTGEEVLELQGHGGMVVMDRLVKAIITEQVRLAQPGEFSERAFLNGKLDLAQAEAIADLIHSTSEQAARCALKSLQGLFSAAINEVRDELIKLRTYVEACLDFPDEAIDFMEREKVGTQLENLLLNIDNVYAKAQQGCLLQEGLTVVIIGPPNAGKSSLLNALSGESLAIVTEVPGTTRDILRHHLQIDGLPLHLLDTAGLRITNDKVEQEGVRRAQAEIDKADLLLLVVESQVTPWGKELDVLASFISPQLKLPPLIIIRNKADLSGETVGLHQQENISRMVMSLKESQGLAPFREYLKESIGFNKIDEGVFTARRRHIEALTEAKEHVVEAIHQLTRPDLLAEELRLAQKFLGVITGEFTSDDLLGEIFSTFCLGK